MFWLWNVIWKNDISVPFVSFPHWYYLISYNFWNGQMTRFVSNCDRSRRNNIKTFKKPHRNGERTLISIQLGSPFKVQKLNENMQRFWLHRNTDPKDKIRIFNYSHYTRCFFRDELKQHRMVRSLSKIERMDFIEITPSIIRIKVLRWVSIKNHYK